MPDYGDEEYGDEGYGGYNEKSQAGGLTEFYENQEVDYNEEQKIETVSHVCA